MSCRVKPLRKQGVTVRRLYPKAIKTQYTLTDKGFGDFTKKMAGNSVKKPQGFFNSEKNEVKFLKPRRAQRDYLNGRLLFRNNSWSDIKNPHLVRLRHWKKYKAKSRNVISWWRMWSVADEPTFKYD